METGCPQATHLAFLNVVPRAKPIVDGDTEDGKVNPTCDRENPPSLVGGYHHKRHKDSRNNGQFLGKALALRETSEDSREASVVGLADAPKDEKVKVVAHKEERRAKHEPVGRAVRSRKDKNVVANPVEDEDCNRKDLCVGRNHSFFGDPQRHDEQDDGVDGDRNLFGIDFVGVLVVVDKNQVDDHGHEANCLEREDDAL